MFWGKQEDGGALVERKVLPKMRKLDTMESGWTGSQKTIKRIHFVTAPLNKKQRSNNQLDSLLIKCRQHGGPFTSSEELLPIQNN